MKTTTRLLAIVLISMGFLAAQEPPAEIPKQTDNAALQYWFAFYFMYDESTDRGELTVGAEAWPSNLSELYPLYVNDPSLFFVTPGDVPKGILPHQIEQETHFKYSPSVLRRKSRPSEVCVLRTKRDDYFGPVRGNIEGYADGHVEWKPRNREDGRPDAAALGMDHARQLLAAMQRYEDDRRAKLQLRDPWSFICEELNAGTVPVAEARKPEIRPICEKNKRAVTEYLRKGASMTRCDFGLDYSRGLLMLLPHLAKTRQLARNAIAYGKLLEAERMPRQAVEVYCDVLTMGHHVAQDRLLVSALVGCDIAGTASAALRQLLAHDPPADACQAALARLSAMPDPYIELGPCFLLEAQLIRPMLFAAFAKEPNPTVTKEDREEIRRLFKHDPATTPPGVNLDDDEKMKEVVKTSYQAYLERMEMAAEIVGEPYPTAVATLREMRKEIDDSANPLIKALVPDLVRMVTIAAQAQTRVRAAAILAAAALHRAKTRKYPETLDALKPYFPQGIPLDPMADKEFAYRLDEGKPRLEGAAPPKEALPASWNDEDRIFGLANILKKERSGRAWTGR
ncbi:MAG: hypothetical protein AB1696_12850 [Planctomycetota bacterium]